MKLDVVWIVRDPTPLSELADVVWEQRIDRLHLYILGSGLETWVREQTTMFSEKDEAVAEGIRRLVRARPEREGWINDEAFRVFEYGAIKPARKGR